jgi:hypothetical protein
MLSKTGNLPVRSGVVANAELSQLESSMVDSKGKSELDAPMNPCGGLRCDPVARRGDGGTVTA